jgi:hypothetical protein
MFPLPTSGEDLRLILDVSSMGEFMIGKRFKYEDLNAFLLGVEPNSWCCICKKLQSRNVRENRRNTAKTREIPRKHAKMYSLCARRFWTKLRDFSQYFREVIAKAAKFRSKYFAKHTAKNREVLLNSAKFCVTLTKLRGKTRLSRKVP